MDPSDDDHNGEHLNVDYLITDIAQAGNSIYWFSPRICSRTLMGYFD